LLLSLPLDRRRPWPKQGRPGERGGDRPCCAGGCRS